MMIYPMVGAGARAQLEHLLKLDPREAMFFRLCGLLLLAHDVLVAFHENPGLLSLDLKCDFDKYSEQEAHQRSARNFFVNYTGELARRLPIGEGEVPLGLLGAGSLLVDRQHPAVEASLAGGPRGDSIRHSRLTHELAWELNASFAHPSLQPLAS